MSLDLSLVQFIGSAFPEPFVNFDLEKILNENKLLPKTAGQEKKQLHQMWSIYRRKLREVGLSSGPLRVKNCVIDSLAEILGYSDIEKAEKVLTRQGREDGGYLLKTFDNKSRLRVWTAPVGTDLESPIKRGHAYRFSFIKIAQRVLLTCQERVGLITDGQELRILISEPSGTDSEVVIKIDTDWKRSYHVPDSFRFLISIVSPNGITFLPELLDKARLKQSAVTQELRVQARQAIEGFIQKILNDPENISTLDKYKDKDNLAKILWHEGLIIIYRLLFILKGEASSDPLKSFSFTGSTIWRNTFSPTVSLAYYVRKCLDENVNTGNFLEKGLKTIFYIFNEGVKSTELNIAPLNGALFGKDSAPFLSQLHWPEKACAYLLDKLLWTIPQRGRNRTSRQRIHYGSLKISDLGNIYELLLELEPGIAQERMCRLRRAKLEVVVPYNQGEKYKKIIVLEDAEEKLKDGMQAKEDYRATKIKWIEEIKEGKFYLRTGLGKKSSGSYYTRESFVRFLIQETLGPKIEEISPKETPYPNRILGIKVLDPAMGSGHFLVKSCSFMAEKLYEACRLCDEKAMELERKKEKEKDSKIKENINKEINFWRDRVLELPDPDDEMIRYLPSSAPESWRSGLSQNKALALCKRLIAVHCLYGVDSNLLAVELAKLSLWLETQSEGLPLTFLDHRLVRGDSITGPFFEHLLKYPGSQKSLEGIFLVGIKEKLKKTFKDALIEINELERSIGIDISDIENKKISKEKLENALLPFKVLAAAWTGGVMLGQNGCDDFEYGRLTKTIAEEGKLPDDINSRKLLTMISKGLGIEEEELNFQEILERIKQNNIIPALSYDLTFPEVFFELTDDGLKRKGFDVVLGNPPWDVVKPKAKEFFARYNFDVLGAPTKRERVHIEQQLKNDPIIAQEHRKYENNFIQQHLIHNYIFSKQVVQIMGKTTGGDPDLAKLFLERFYQFVGDRGLVGVVVPSAFHANEGATGLRQLYLKKMALKKCYSFENKRKLFDIDSRFKFALIVSEKNKNGTNQFLCKFYLHDDDWLFQEQAPLKYNLDFVKKTGGEYLSFIELKTWQDLEIANKCFGNISKCSFSRFLKKYDINFLREFDMTNDSWRFVERRSISDIPGDARLPHIARKIQNQQFLILYEGKTFHQFNDIWGNEPNYLVPLKKLIPDKIQTIINAQYYRASYRAVASSTNERTIIFSLLPSGMVFGNSAPVETNIKRPSYVILYLIGFANSFPFDWIARQMVGANVNQFILYRIPIVVRKKDMIFISHLCLRLISNHIGYENIWHEQLGNTWRESNKKPFNWPVLETEEERWNVRSAIDVVVADTYGLNREQYEHILKSFDRASGPNPYTGVCLEKYDELKKIGIEKFTKKYDPYWDIPLNEELPKPVIEIPIPKEEKTQQSMF